MKTKWLPRLSAAALMLANIGGCAQPDPAAPAASPARPAAPVESTPPSTSAGSKESSRPPPQPAPAEARKPEEAAARAADPKDPSGALIIKKPGEEIGKEAAAAAPRNNPTAN